MYWLPSVKWGFYVKNDWRDTFLLPEPVCGIRVLCAAPLLSSWVWVGFIQDEINANVQFSITLARHIHFENLKQNCLLSDDGNQFYAIDQTIV